MIDLWTLNVIHYVTAILVLELNGNLREEKKKRKPHGKPGWQIWLESRADAIRRRRKLSHINVIAECKKIQKYTKHQKNIRERRSINRTNEGQLTECLRSLQERRSINRMFKLAPKRVYRAMKDQNSKPVSDMPEQSEVNNFWRSLWSS